MFKSESIREDRWLLAIYYLHSPCCFLLAARFFSRLCHVWPPSVLRLSALRHRSRMTKEAQAQKLTSQQPLFQPNPN
jgi:hypothetical protein